METADTVNAVHRRVCELLSGARTARESICIALAAGCHGGRDAILEFIIGNRSASAEALHSADSIALKEDEWVALFGCSSRQHAPSSELAQLRTEQPFRSYEQEFEAALRCSLLEASARQQWDKSTQRAACYVAMHSDAAEERIAAVLGCFVKADSRRLDELRITAEDNRADALLLCKAVMALSASVATDR